MSTRDDATLSAAERAALAGLEAQAQADDPRLAAQLRGSRHTLPSFRVPPAVVHALRTWMGPCAVVAGLAIMILALSQSTLLASGGALLFLAGGLLSAGMVRSGVEAALHVLPRPEPGGGEGDTDRADV